MPSIAKAFAIIAIFALSSPVRAESDEGHLAVTRIDRDGRVAGVAVVDKISWDFENGLCQNFMLHEPALDGGSAWQVTDASGVRVVPGTKNISICLSQESAEFTLSSKQGGKNVFYHYLLEMARRDPPVVMDKACGDLTVVSRSDLNRKFFAVGVSCQKRQGDSGPVSVTLFPGKFSPLEILPDQEVRVNLPTASRKAIASLVLAYHPLKVPPAGINPPKVSETPAGSLITRKDGVIKLEAGIGGGMYSDQMAYDLSPANNLDRSHVAPKFSGYRRTVFGAKNLFNDLFLESSGLGSKDFLLQYGMGVLYRLLDSAGMDGFVGGGGYGIYMNNSSNYGISQAVAPEVVVQLERKNLEWGVRGSVSSLGNGLSFGVNRFELRVFGSLPRFKSYFVSADYQNLKVSQALSTGVAAYSGSSFGLTLGWRIEGKKQ